MSAHRRIGHGEGHGKVLLCGEHAVVHGHPALALAVDRSTTVEVELREGPTTVESPLGDDRVFAAIRRVIGEQGHAVRIRTNLPVGRGMGSSAALAVGLARAVSSLTSGEPLTPQQAYDRAMPLEREFHGNPSGVDVAVSCEGGCLWFQRQTRADGTAEIVRESVALGPWSLVVLDSGRAGDTRALVAGVAERRPGIDADLERIGDLVHEARAAMGDSEALGALLTENHGLLQAIGVSTPELDDLVALALRAGARGAKLSGAGGGGIVIALVDDPSPVLAAAQERGVPAFGCQPWAR